MFGSYTNVKGNVFLGKKAAVLIVIVWLCSSAISFPAIAWWRATDPSRPIPQLTCPFTEDLGYLVFRYYSLFFKPFYFFRLELFMCLALHSALLLRNSKL